MSGRHLRVGAHDPMVFAGLGAVWVECECGWISESYYTELLANAAHDRHVARTAVI